MNFKRILAFTLTIFLLIPCLGISTAFAAPSSPKYAQEGFTYVCFGDSFARGMGCTNWEELVEPEYGNSEHQTRNVYGSYAYLVAKELGCNLGPANNYLEEPNATFWPLVHNGQMLSGVLDFFGIEDNYFDSLFCHNYETTSHAYRYDRFVDYFGSSDSVWAKDPSKTYGDIESEVEGDTYGTTYDARDLVKKADLITVQLGMGDILNRPVYAAAGEYLSGGLKFDGVDAETIAKFVVRVVELMYESYEYFIKAYPLLINYLKTQNEGGSVILVSISNPAFGINLSNEVLLPIGNAFSAISALVNQHIKKTAEEYGVPYVDVSNVDTNANENDWSLDDVFRGGNDRNATHPSDNGHAQIARMIIDAYQNQNKSATRNIVVDLGRFSSIDYVMLDGRMLGAKEYKVENSVLTIKNFSILHRSMTVAVKKDTNDFALTSYRLQYELGKGYSAYRTYTTNSVAAVAKSIF